MGDRTERLVEAAVIGVSGAAMIFTLYVLWALV